MGALISVIIPCYNVEDYIDRCLDSLVNQTIGIENLELILVNDASTDRTLEKLQNWEKRYPDLIIVITYDTNIRQGGARNIGLQYASADYIGYVDSDDWAEPDMYDTLYKCAIQGDYDMVKGKFVRDTGHEPVVINQYPRDDYRYEAEKKGSFYNIHTPKIGNNGEMGGVPTGLYKRSLLIDNNILFPEGTAYEDNYWGQILRLYVKNMYIVDKVIYHYFVNPNSTVTSRNALHQLDRLDIELQVLEKYKELGAFDLFYNDLEKNFIKKFYLNTLYIIFTRFDYLPDIMNTMIETVKNYFPEYKKRLNMRDYNSRQRMLLALLETNYPLSMEEQLNVKLKYLKSLYLNEEI